MRTVKLSNGVEVPALGLGTWYMGEQRQARSMEVRALRTGLDLGMTLIDTAEMYAEGGAEEVVGEAIAGRRDGVHLVSKVYPHNASLKGTVAACERSLKRLRTDRIDLYLLHWRGTYPLAETIEAFEGLKAAGKIGGWGVSNFDPNDMLELERAPSGRNCVSNQVLYHVDERGIEWDLLAHCRKSGIMVMAYSPLGQGQVLGDATIGRIARKHGVTPAAIALAFVLRQPGVVAIPKSARDEHVKANARALDVVLDEEDLAVLNKAFPAPTGPSRLAML